jgi:hypothetical protein
MQGHALVIKEKAGIREGHPEDETNATEKIQEMRAASRHVLLPSPGLIAHLYFLVCQHHLFSFETDKASLMRTGRVYRH